MDAIAIAIGSVGDRRVWRQLTFLIDIPYDDSDEGRETKDDDLKNDMMSALRRRIVRTFSKGWLDCLPVDSWVMSVPRCQL